MSSYDHALKQFRSKDFTLNFEKRVLGLLRVFDEQGHSGYSSAFLLAKLRYWMDGDDLDYVFGADSTEPLNMLMCANIKALAAMLMEIQDTSERRKVFETFSTLANYDPLP